MAQSFQAEPEAGACESSLRSTFLPSQCSTFLDSAELESDKGESDLSVKTMPWTFKAEPEAGEADNDEESVIDDEEEEESLKRDVFERVNVFLDALDIKPFSEGSK